MTDLTKDQIVTGNILNAQFNKINDGECLSMEKVVKLNILSAIKDSFISHYKNNDVAFDVMTFTKLVFKLK